MGFSLFRSTSKKPSVVTRERIHAVAGRELPLRVLENPRAKRLTLRIETGGKGLRVTIPPGLPDREVQSFLVRHQGWIESRIAKMPDQAGLRAGVKIPIRGVPHLITHQAGRGTVDLLEGNVLLVHGDPAHLSRRIADYLKHEVKRDIEQLVARHTATVGRKAKAVRFKDTKSRWGSCTSDGVLSFSWRIGMAPAPVINYLVAHEVAHLIEMNHGPKFWKLCHELCPDTERCKAWLKRNGSALQAIDFT
ncbi:M48 family metallopeptidase [Brucella pseudogrignonensis]|uniref:Metal-dependent hydrolase n=1 Tax=Brucella pseudogrignonensis TaxID=419475 RepID=A0ABU1M9Q7_9HYPH|nr:M48 family metallopeptidase [Brucella pseudogrignonensis]MDR6432767.1 putative metal-dependent hydrolase [Brucella pseudogrignonensis]